MLGSWDEMIEMVGRAPGMYVGRPKYSLVRSYVEGFGAGRGDGVLERFQRWISEQPQHSSHRNYAWCALILDEVYPDRRRPPAPYVSEWDTGWPRPAPHPVDEDDLAYPGEDQVAIEHLFARLREFLTTVTRSLTPRERAVLDALLSVEFGGVTELRAQAATALARGDSFAMDLVVDRTLPPAPVDGPLRVEAPVQGHGYDGGIILFIRGGRLWALEYWWVTERKPKEFPASSMIGTPVIRG